MTARSLLIALLCAAGALSAAAQAPRHVVLTWRDDPATSAVVNVHLAPGEPLVAKGARWRALDRGPEPDEAWIEADFDDAAWIEGAAPLGYGEKRIKTKLRFGGDPDEKRMRTCFRHRFRVADPAAIERLVLGLDRIDGAIVYLNGQEVLRSNLELGELDGDSEAANEAEDIGSAVSAEIDRERWRPLLKAGDNVLAVALHRAYSDGDVLLFDLELRAVRQATVATVRWDTESRAGKPTDYRQQATGDGVAIPGVADRLVHAVALQKLPPASKIYFVVGREGEWSEELWFRTLPASPEKLSFVNGGDMGTGAVVDGLLTRAAALEPDFVVIGGDIAYANAKLDKFALWDSWLASYSRRMRGKGGRLIPLLVTPGNHDVVNGYRTPGVDRNQAPLLEPLLLRGQGGSYLRRDFGTLLRLIALDSDHMVSPEAQMAFIEESLKTSKARHLAAVYHVPLYPSVRPVGNGRSAELRRRWLPLFDRYKLHVAYEHHDHALKRSHPLRGGKPQPGGTLYLGDGAMGKGGRKPTMRPYLARVDAKLHFWFTELSGSRFKARAIGTGGEVLDTVERDAPK